MNSKLTEAQKLEEAKGWLSRVGVFNHRRPPTVGIVLGSGMGAFVDEVQDQISAPFNGIPHFPKAEGEAVKGHGHRMIVGNIGNLRAIIQEGRVHPYEGPTLREAAFPTRLMVWLGAKIVILTHAVGAVSRNLEPREFVVVRGHIAPHSDDPLSGLNEPKIGVQFLDMGEVYTRRLIALATQCALQERIAWHRGVSIYHHGPTLETPEEVEDMRRRSADVCTMSAIYEATAAHHMRAEVLDIATVVNMAAGIVLGKFTHDETLANAAACAEPLARLLKAILKGLGAEVSTSRRRKRA